MSTFISTVIGVLAGGLITTVVSWILSKKASKELREEAKELKNEAKELRDLITLIVRNMESNLGLEFTRDENGKPKGIVHDASVKMEGVSSMEIKGYVTKSDSPTQSNDPEPADKE